METWIKNNLAVAIIIVIAVIILIAFLILRNNKDEKPFERDEDENI
jgi:hypothetical protein